MAERRTCNAEVEISTFSRSTNPGFVAQRVEHHAEDVSAAVSKSAEATKLSARSLAWLEALALHPANMDPFAGAPVWERDDGSSNLSAQTKFEHLWCELD